MFAYFIEKLGKKVKLYFLLHHLPLFHGLVKNCVIDSFFFVYLTVGLTGKKKKLWYYAISQLCSPDFRSQELHMPKTSLLDLLRWTAVLIRPGR